MQLEIDASHAESTTSLFLIVPKHAQLRSVDYAKLALVALLAICFAAAPSFAQSNSSPSSSTAPATTPQSTKAGKPLVHTNTTVTVSADLTPEEKENAEIEKHTAYYHGKAAEPGCDELIRNYKTDLIPLAQQAKFPINKGKYLYTAYEGIGSCQLKQGHYADAEQSFRDALPQAEIWPGTTDSAYPSLYLNLAYAQMALEQWTDLGASSAKAAELLQAEIEVRNARLASSTGNLADFVHDELVHIHRQRARALSGLAFAYDRDGKLEDAATAIEAAYQDAQAGKLDHENIDAIVRFGSSIALERKKEADITTWLSRLGAPDTPAQAPPKN